MPRYNVYENKQKESVLTPHNIHFTPHWLIVRARKRFVSRGIVHGRQTVKVSFERQMVEEIAHLRIHVSGFEHPINPEK